jgi:hypothetical protein
MGEMRDEYNILVRKPKAKRPLGRIKRGCEVNIRMDFREIGQEFVDWMHLTQDSNQWWALVNTVMNFRVP